MTKQRNQGLAGLAALVLAAAILAAVLWMFLTSASLAETVIFLSQEK